MVQAFGQALGLLFFVVGVGWVLLLIVVQHRLYRAYIARYGDRRRRWQRWFGWPPDGFWFTSQRFYFTRYDDPLVERRRRQYWLAWIVPFGIISGFVVLAVFREIFLLVVGIYFGSLVVALSVTWYRFIVAYNRHYRGLTGWPLLVHSLFGPPWRALDMQHEWDDPEVDRLRRRAARVWHAWFVSLLIPFGVFVVFVPFVLFLLVFDALR